MYKPEIALEIEKLHKVNGVGNYSLEAFNQNDVQDTMNYLHAKNPSIYDESSIRYTGLADINILS
ncbi:hypothetical protein [Liquorilactobacillus nagelii]|uniref:hypothetical protein n=1 Tax=Liquorilactobacillus nagelii TaxID=82688 RepID=UPI0039E89B36